MKHEQTTTRAHGKRSLWARLFSDRHMVGGLDFDFKALFTRALIWGGRRIYRNGRGDGAYALAPPERALGFDDSVEFIRRGIESREPFMAGKIGTGDGESLSRYIDKTADESAFVKWLKILAGRRGPYWWDNSIRGGVCVCGGVFPPEDEAIEEFCRIFMPCCAAFDGFARCTYGEGRLFKMLCPGATPIVMDALVPLGTPHTWYGALAGRKVLVVHQYVETIRAQYAKRVEFHKGQGVLPEFELLQYRPVNSAGGVCPEFASWPEALQHMIDDISAIDFDVALLGCGVYGVPLSAAIKRLGKAAIYTGGATQAIFGIKGGRWDDSGIYNGEWTRPLPQDIPRNMELIEHASFI